VIGQWSNSATADTWRFMRNPSQVTQLTPTQAQDVTTPVLSWTPKAGIPTYRVTILKSNKTTAVGGTPAVTYATSYADGRTESRGWSVLLVCPGDRRERRASAAPANPTRSFTVSAPTTDTNLTFLTRR
jgi:hypothetical protein